MLWSHRIPLSHMVYVLRSIYADYKSLFFDKTPFITDVLTASSRSPYGTDMW